MDFLSSLRMIIKTISWFGLFSVSLMHIPYIWMLCASVVKESFPKGVTLLKVVFPFLLMGFFLGVGIFL